MDFHQLLEEFGSVPRACYRCQQTFLTKELCRPSPEGWTSRTRNDPFLRKCMELNSHWYCELCMAAVDEESFRQLRLRDLYRRQIALVAKHKKRARLVRCEATLTLKQWLTTLHHFQWRCAYCQGPYETLEHLIPIQRGGGTTAGNCIPSCKSCNSRKGLRLPDEIIAKESSLSPEAQRRVKNEIESLHV